MCGCVLIVDQNCGRMDRVCFASLAAGVHATDQVKQNSTNEPLRHGGLILFMEV